MTRGFFTVLAMVFMITIGIFQPAWANYRFPSELVGEWQGSDGLTFRIEAHGQMLNIYKPNKNGLDKKWVGPFKPQGEMNLLFSPKRVEELSGNFPRSVFEDVIRMGHQFQGTLEIQDNGDLKLVEYLDDVSHENGHVTKIVPKTGDRVIILSRSGVYTIRDLAIQWNKFQQEVGEELAQLQQQHHHIATVEIPLLQQEQQQAARQLEEHKNRVLALTQQQQALQEKIRDAQHKLNEIQKKRPQTLVDLEQKKANLEKAVKTAEDHLLQEQQLGNAISSQSFENLARLKKDLQKTERQIHQLYKKIAPPETMVQLENQIHQAMKALDDLGYEKLKALNPTKLDEERLITRTAALQEKQQALRDLEKKMDTLRQGPKVMQVTLTSGDHPRFMATIKNDPEILEAFHQDIQNLETAKRDLEEEIQDVKALLEGQSKQDKDAALENFKAAILSLNEAGEAVALEIEENLGSRVALEGVMTGVDLATGFVEGGVLGMASEVAQKAAEVYLDVDPIEFSYDESGLREEVLGQAKEAGLLDSINDFNTQEAGKILIAAAREIPNYYGQILQEKYRTTYEFSRNGGALPSVTSHPPLKALAEKSAQAATDADNARNAYESAQKAMAKTIRDMEVLENATIHLPENSTTREEIIRQVREKRTQAGENLIGARRNMNQYSDALERAQKKVNHANKRIEELTDKRKALSSFLKSTAIGVGLDTLEQMVKSTLDAQEAAQWKAYFAQEIAAKVAYAQYRRAANQYWAVYDHHQALLDTKAFLEVSQERARMNLARFLDTSNPDGFRTLMNEPFGASDQQLNLDIEVMGPISWELTLLSGPYAPGDPNNKSRKHFIHGAPVARKIEASTVSTTADLTQTKVHRYTFQGAELKDLSETGGRLPLIIAPHLK